MSNIKYLAKKWYEYLKFPTEYKEHFDNILTRDDIDSTLTAKSCSEISKLKDFELNLIYALYSLEALKAKYDDLGISEGIFKDTMNDIRIWATDYLERSGKGGLEHINWISHHLTFSLFKLGRLQFNFAPSEMDYKPLKIKKGNNTLGVHIPRGEPFTPEAWEASFEIAKEFFAKFFPQYSYEYFSCFSWFLSPDLDKLVDKNSNILKFQKLFDVAYTEENDIMLYFTFGWGTTLEDLENIEAKTSLQRKIKEYIKAGNKLTHGYGFIRKNSDE